MRVVMMLSLLMSLSCGSGIEGLGQEAGPLVTLQIELDETSFQAYITSALEQGVSPSLRVGVVWAGVPDIDPYCIEYGPNPLNPGGVKGKVAEVACVDPFQVVPALVDESVPAELGVGPIALPLYDLPTAEVLVGPPQGRIAYATLVVFDDRNGNGLLDVVGSGGEFRVGSREPSEDVVVAASFSYLLNSQLRLVFREGSYNESSFFYPMIGCAAPPEGYSFARVTGTPIQSQCTYLAVTEPISLRAGNLEDLEPLLCRTDESSYRMPRDEVPEEELQECVTTTELVVANPEDACPRIRHFNLAGCSGNPFCSDPDWDFTDDPPAWWFCNDPDVTPLEDAEP